MKWILPLLGLLSISSSYGKVCRDNFINYFPQDVTVRFTSCSNCSALTVPGNGGSQSTTLGQLNGQWEIAVFKSPNDPIWDSLCGDYVGGLQNFTFIITLDGHCGVLSVSPCQAD